jgi:phosphatidylserine decarboxylase
MLKDYFKAHIPEFNVANRLPVARPGLPFILAATLVVVVCLTLDWDNAAWVFFILWLFVVWFFRDPCREAPPGTFGLSPADGKVIRVDRTAVCPMSGVPALKISIFMDLFSVHVNRIPVAGRLLRQEHFPGVFLNAAFDKASADNERNCLLLEDERGRRVAVVQIAGLVARRIVSWVQPEQALLRGQRFGMIRFGSRLDVYLPLDTPVEVMVGLGQAVKAGWSPLWRYLD